MLELKDGFVLYHGSYCEVKAPDLGKCAKRKDFGQGFYLTTSHGEHGFDFPLQGPDHKGLCDVVHRPLIWTIPHKIVL